MRKLLLISAILALMLGILVLGYKCGIRHAIEDCDMWILEMGDPVTIHIDLDGNWYEHTCYIG